MQPPPSLRTHPDRSAHVADERSVDGVAAPQGSAFGIEPSRQRLVAEVIDAYIADIGPHGVPLSMAAFDLSPKGHPLLVQQFRSVDLVLWVGPRRYLVLLAAVGPAAVHAVRRSRMAIQAALPHEACRVGIAEVPAGFSVSAEELLRSVTASLEAAHERADGVGPLVRALPAGLAR